MQYMSSKFSCTSDIARDLAALLRVDAMQVSDRIREPFDRARAISDRPIIVVGCGPLGRYIAAGLRQVGRPVLAFSDNNASRWGDEIDGLTVHAPSIASATFGDDALFVVAIYNGSAVRSQLRELGCAYVIHFNALLQAFPDALMPHGSIADPDRTLRASSDVMSALNVWADEASCQEYVSQIAWRLGSGDDNVAAPDPMSELYFASDLFQLNNEDVIVDCGAFDGDSLRALLASTTQEFGRYIGLEPDPRTYSALSTFVTKLPSELQRKIVIFPVAVASSSGPINFSATGSVASKAEVNGEVLVLADTLDKLVGEQHPDFVKMDIEGQELDALRGSRMILVKDQPILAISLYHKPEDLWEIPAFIKSVVPGYQLFLRRYAEDCWETVCYAVPEHRLMGSKIL